MSWRSDESDLVTGCNRARQIMSAALDGETDPPEPLDWAYQHLAGCADCADWVDQVARLDRTLRIGEAVDHDSTDLAESLLRLVRLPRRRWRRPVLRAVLFLVAGTQLVLGLIDMSGMLGMNMPGMNMPHLDHEEAAFNIAFGIALAMVAWNQRRAAGQVPVLATFVLVLAVSSIVDLADGAVTGSRLLTHLPILVGLLLSAALSRLPEPEPGPLTRTTHRRGWSMRRRSGDVPVPGAHAVSSTGRQTPPAARQDVA